MSLAPSLWTVLLLFLGAACDPQGPGATGLITVAAGVSLEAGRTLEIRLLPDDGEPFAVATAPVTDRASGESRDLAQVALPFEYWVGGGLGTTEFERWRVVAWIAESDGVDRLREGEWYGTRSFVLAKCGFPHGGYCGVVPDIDISIDSRKD